LNACAGLVNLLELRMAPNSLLPAECHITRC
jgi:hypothetical protein